MEPVNTLEKIFSTVFAAIRKTVLAILTVAYHTAAGFVDGIRTVLDNWKTL